MVVLAPAPARTVTRPSVPAASSVAVAPSVAVALDGQAARRALDARDRKRCAGLPTAGARRDFRAGRLAVRRAVAGLADGSSRPRGVRVSLAHREGRGLAAAVAPGARVGVDLEREGTVIPAQARYFLTARERVACGSVDPTELWTLKESVWKLLGLSRGVAFHAVEVVSGGPGSVPGAGDTRSGGAGSVPGAGDTRSGGVVHVRYAGRRLRARYRIWCPWPGWIGTVVWCGGQGR